eukprot:scaffold5842_cov55-Phaeocystis_antarctica.AAC.3
MMQRPTTRSSSEMTSPHEIMPRSRQTATLVTATGHTPRTTTITQSGDEGQSRLTPLEKWTTTTFICLDLEVREFIRDATAITNTTRGGRLDCYIVESEASLNCFDEVRRTHGGLSPCSPGVSQGRRGCACHGPSTPLPRAHLTTAPSRPPQEAPHLPAAWQLVSRSFSCKRNRCSLALPAHTSVPLPARAPP